VSSTTINEETVASDVAGKESLGDLLRRMNELEASDLHLKPMRPPLVRLKGELVPLVPDSLTPEAIGAMLNPIIPERLRPRLAEQMAVEFGYGIGRLSRFRVSIYHQRGTLAAVLRRVAFDFPSLEDWGLPEVLGGFCDLPQGLVLVTGPTGSGKSSTLAAMIQKIASTRKHHIVTIEDPIEFLINDDEASVSQREVGTETPGFTVALHNALRMDPDVIMVGEMRDEETINTVLTAAETGHLVYSTLHTNSAVQTVDRIVGTFPNEAHGQVRQRLAAVLEAAVSMQLVPRADGTGMVAAVEILRRTPQVSKLIQQGEFERLREEVESSVSYFRMQSMNQSLAALVIHGTIERETAMSVSWNPDALDLMLRKVVGEPDPTSMEGDAMAESTADFSKILEFQEIKRSYDELNERYRGDVERRDEEIRNLREELYRLRDAGEGSLNELRAENEQLRQDLERARRDYEQRMARMGDRMGAEPARASTASPAREQRSTPPDPSSPGGKRGFFRK
jgi:twitching motility protein PilT